jgi:dTDP-4-amino-4,6-dideoxygalactose transaminase
MASTEKECVSNTREKQKSLNDLGFFGGTPLFNDKLHVGRPNIGNRDRFLSRVNDILDRRWLTNNGLYVQEFEQRIAEFVGVKHCIATCNATIALEIAIRATELKGEVIIPAFTFIATAHSLQWQEITPVFCDIDPLTHNINSLQIEQKITPRTTGIMGVHLWGRPCNVEALSEIARHHNLKLIFDASHAFGCSYKGKMVGSFGDVEVFSFHATKFLNAFEGGAIVTNNDELATKIRLIKNFGFAGNDNVIHIGTNGKMNEVSAAMGVTGLESLSDFIDVNHQNYKHYQQELATIPGVKLIIYDETEQCNYQYIVLEIDELKFGVTRDKLIEVLSAENIMARRYFYPGCHQMEPYRSYFPYNRKLLPETDKLSLKIISLPTGTAVSLSDISKICQAIKLVAENSHHFQDAKEDLFIYN